MKNWKMGFRIVYQTWMTHMSDNHQVTCMNTRYLYPRKIYPRISYYIYTRTRT
jgi:hypothetical protein